MLKITTVILETLVLLFALHNAFGINLFMDSSCREDTPMVRNNVNWSKSAEAIKNWLESCVSLESPRSYSRFTKLRAIFEMGRPHFVSADPNNEGEGGHGDRLIHHRQTHHWRIHHLAHSLPYGFTTQRIHHPANSSLC